MIYAKPIENIIAFSICGPSLPLTSSEIKTGQTGRNK